MSEILKHIHQHHIEYRLIGTFLTPILVVAGWVIVNNQNNKREDRKELRKFIDDLVSKVEELEKLSIEFHTSKKYIESNASSILSQYSKITAQLGRSRLDCFNCYDSAIKLHESISEDNFSSNNFKKQNHNSELINNILTQSSIFIDALESLFYNTTRLTLPQRIAKSLSRQANNKLFISIFCILLFIFL